MNAEYKKAAEKLLCGITDKQLYELTIWNDILSSVRSGKLRLWEINDEILRIKYFCKEKIERASAFTESDKSGVRFDDLNAYFVEAIKNGDKGYFGAFIHAYEPVLQSRAERFVEVLGIDRLSTKEVKSKITEIRAEKSNVVVFCMEDGSEIVKRWKDRSRAESWTPEMKEQARQRALQARRKKK